MSKQQIDPLTTILTQYRQLCAAHRNAQENIDRLHAHERELMGQIADCFAAARVFQFDLIAEFQRAAKDDLQQPRLDGHDPIAPGSLPLPPISPVRSEPTIRDLVFRSTQKAHPKSVRASLIRLELANLGHFTHEKTVGMTLYRLSKEGFVRRVGGRDWCFVPELERSAGLARQDSGLEPMQQFDAPLAS